MRPCIHAAPTELEIRFYPPTPLTPGATDMSRPTALFLLASPSWDALAASPTTRRDTPRVSVSHGAAMLMHIERLKIPASYTETRKHANVPEQFA